MLSGSSSLPPAVYPLTWLYIIIVSIGVVANMLIVAATVREKTLHSSCCILIALCSALDSLNLLGASSHIFAVLSDNLMVPQSTCVWMQLPTIIGGMGGKLCVFCIGIDRLYACSRPLDYSANTSKLYLFAHIFSVYAFAIGFMIFCALHIDDDSPVICYLFVAVPKAARPFWLNSSPIIYFASFVIYCFVYWRLRNSGMAARGERAIFRGLYAVVVVTIGCWMTTSTMGRYFHFVLFKDDPAGQFLGHLIAALPVYLSMTSNYLIFYTTSSHYRTAFRKQLGWTFPCGRASASPIGASVISIKTVGIATSRNPSPH